MEEPIKLNFGGALEQLKHGAKVERIGWNKHHQFLWLNKGSKAEPVNEGEIVEGIKFDGMFVQGDTGTVTRLPNINMHTAEGYTITGWVPSQVDMLAEDWVIVE